MASATDGQRRQLPAPIMAIRVICQTPNFSGINASRSTRGSELYRTPKRFLFPFQQPSNIRPVCINKYTTASNVATSVDLRSVRGLIKLSTQTNTGTANAGIDPSDSITSQPHHNQQDDTRILTTAVVRGAANTPTPVATPLPPRKPTKRERYGLALRIPLRRRSPVPRINVATGQTTTAAAPFNASSSRVATLPPLCLHVATRSSRRFLLNPFRMSLPVFALVWSKSNEHRTEEVTGIG